MHDRIQELCGVFGGERGRREGAMIDTPIGTENGFAEATSYFADIPMSVGPDEYVQLVANAKKKIGIPVIASLNCVGSKSWDKAREAGLKVATPREAAAEADIIMMLTPDETTALVLQCVRYRNNVLTWCLQAIEAVAPFYDRTIEGFGELFRARSLAEIGTAAMLSRASAGLVGHVAVFCIPGSTGAARLALEDLILPEIGHILTHVNK